jgi:hypothetical protein
MLETLDLFPHMLGRLVENHIDSAIAKSMILPAVLKRTSETVKSIGGGRICYIGAWMGVWQTAPAQAFTTWETDRLVKGQRANPTLEEADKISGCNIAMA